MSFTIIEQVPGRLNRSGLAVPGSNPMLLEKAQKSAADAVFIASIKQAEVMVEAAKQIATLDK